MSGAEAVAGAEVRMAIEGPDGSRVLSATSDDAGEAVVEFPASARGAWTCARSSPPPPVAPPHSSPVAASWASAARFSRIRWG